MKLIYKLNFACNSFIYCWVDKTDEKFELSPHFITEMEAESWKERIIGIMKEQLTTFDFDDWK